jgi:hypothetical protein
VCVLLYTRHPKLLKTPGPRKRTTCTAFFRDLAIGSSVGAVGALGDVNVDVKAIVKAGG